MPNLKNKTANMEIGYVGVGEQKKLYIRIGQEMEYYGTLMSGKADKFLKMLKKWDDEGGNDGD